MSKITIIAEAGVNHNGDLELAKKLIRVAAECGVDYVKFQTFKADKIANRFAEKADYQKRNTEGAKNEESQLEMLKKLELRYEDFEFLSRYARENGVKFLSTPFDFESIEFLNGLDMDFFKIPSGEVTNLPYLRLIASKGKPVVMSTGMCGLKEIEEALAVLYAGGLTKNQVTLLHCNTEYPTPFADVNLRAMETLRTRFETKVGYSDHTRGIEVSLAAAALGASVIEKHFTLDKNLPGPDHKASVDPAELHALVSSIRHIEEALGSPEKEISESEAGNIAVARKSIVAARHIKIGEIFTEENLTVKRPGTGLSPMLWDQVLGQRAKCDFQTDQLIEL